MTNSPVYSDQIAINKYWESVGSINMLPGTNRASDRYVRASYYINSVKRTKKTTEALPALISIVRSLSVPIGISEEEKPNMATTIWRTYGDHINKCYYFENTSRLFMIWVDLKKIDFKSKFSIKKIELEENLELLGDVTDRFKKAESFKFMTE